MDQFPQDDAPRYDESERAEMELEARLKRAEARLAARTLELREARLLLGEMLRRLDDEADIDWGGGANLAMRLAMEFRARVERLVLP